MASPFAVYREFLPHAALQPHIRAVFSFVPGTEDGRPSPILADGHACLSFTLGEGGSGHIAGAVTHTDGLAIERPSMIGAYFRAGGLTAFTSLPLHELTNRTVRVEDIWGPAAANIAARLAESSESARVAALESVLIERLGAPPRTQHGSVDVPGLAASIERRAGRVSVEQMACDAGVSRQQLARTFRERVGVTPKLYARLARFRSSLAYMGAGEATDRAHAALALGYADQSHWIAEFKEFSGLTPRSFAARRWVHPFVERAVRGTRSANLTHSTSPLSR
jgi:AraC-like DNA-binding protein